MSKELVISANRHETKVALIEDDQLVEVYFQRANEYSLAGSIHKGRVTRVLPGMQSAFVDLGLERDTFLYVSDFLEEHEDFDRITGDERPPRPERDRDRQERDRRPPPQQAAPPAQAAAEAPAQPEAAEAAPSVPPAPSAERNEDRGERRGRRSRRRRNRGRGFPDSKYAPESGGQDDASRATPPATGTAPATELVEQAAGAEENIPRILPGESLAKYRSADPRDPVEATPPPLPAIESAATGSEGSAVVTEYDEPIHYPPENAMPDAPAHENAPPEVLAAISAAEPVSAEHAEAEAVAESGPAVAPMLDEEEDRDIQEMILEHAEALEEPEGVDETAPASSQGGPETTPPAELESGTAAVRERGARFPHRVSRRIRRRGRGGPPPEGLPREGRPFEGRPDQGRASAVTAPERPSTFSRPEQGQPSISDLLKEGQEIIVQIAKEPLGQKGARITSHIALPGRYVVYMPTLEHMGVSRKIGGDEERLRLKRILQARRPGPVGGFITRTAAEGRTEEEIASDMEFLYNLWQDIRQKAERRPAPLLLHHDLDIVHRILRDQLADSFKAIWIDNEETYESVLRFMERFQPALVGKVKLYTREAPIFDAFSVTAELEKALRPKVWLKSGGYIVINQTEALVAIDVNTGKYVGKSNRLEDTIVKTNTEAIKEIVRQIRLRDLGGIIVIDFIDMDERKNRQKVMAALEEAIRVDRAPYKILQFNDFGLVAITRKRVKQSLERTLCAPCPHCDGAGYIKSVQTVVAEILTEARKLASSVEGKEVMLRVHPDVAKVIKSNQNKFLEELEEVLRRPVLVRSDALLHHEKFDLA
jgi:Rne/Rng family ribonuclease